MRLQLWLLYSIRITLAPTLISSACAVHIAMMRIFISVYISVCSRCCMYFCRQRAREHTWNNKTTQNIKHEFDGCLRNLWSVRGCDCSHRLLGKGVGSCLCAHCAYCWFVDAHAQLASTELRCCGCLLKHIT